MKIKIAVTLITIATLAACTSTVTQDQASTVPAEIQNKIKANTPLTDKELKKLVENTKFTTAQLKDAAKSLGYRCTSVVVTGSHMKKKICSTQQQRDVLAEATRAHLANIRYQN